jgi:exopolysaccharide biosynthesis polyprenyl glycosylphosphotransferase
VKFPGFIAGSEKYMSTCVFLTTCSLVVLYFYGFFQRHTYVDRFRLLFGTIKVWFAVLILYLIIGFLSKYAFFIEGRVFTISVFALLLCVYMVTHQVVIPHLLCTRSAMTGRQRPCCYIGPDKYAGAFEEFLKVKPVLGLQITHHNTAPTSEKCSDREVFLVSNATHFGQLYEEIVNNLDGNRVLHVASSLFDELRLKWEWTRFQDLPVYTFKKKNNKSARSYVRRWVDIVGSIFWISMLLPVFLVIAVAVKLDSKGPVLFKQKRCGCNGKEFTFYKFRSMVECDTEDTRREQAFKEYIEKKTSKGKIVNHDGVTRVGSILRKTSLDELPQLWNVLCGDMSMVGPRPPIPYEVKHYQAWHRDRLSVKPGLTGLWQVHGRGVLPCDHSVFLDLMYTINRSISMDVKLILQTIPSVIFGKGAY